MISNKISASYEIVGNKNNIEQQSPRATVGPSMWGTCGSCGCV